MKNNREIADQLIKDECYDMFTADYGCDVEITFDELSSSEDVNGDFFYYDINLKWMYNKEPDKLELVIFFNKENIPTLEVVASEDNFYDFEDVWKILYFNYLQKTSE